MPELVDYEVGVGPPQADGLPMGVGVSSTQVGAAVTRFVVQLNAGLAVLDALVPSGQRPADSDTLEAVVNLTAVAHGEWVRIHPFANGNGRTARLLCAWIALRYRLPVFVRVKPRPDDIAYAAAGRDSMGRPPDFIGDHAPTAYLFMHLLRQALTDL